MPKRSNLKAPIVGAALVVIVALIGAYMFGRPIATNEELKDAEGTAQTSVVPQTSKVSCQGLTGKVPLYACCISQMLASYPEKVTHRERQAFDKDAGLSAQKVEGKLNTVAKVDSSVEALFSGKPDKELAEKIREDCRYLADGGSDATASTQSEERSASSEAEKLQKNVEPQPPAATTAVASRTSEYVCQFQLKNGGSAQESISAKGPSEAQVKCAAICENKFKNQCRLEK